MDEIDKLSRSYINHLIDVDEEISLIIKGHLLLEKVINDILENFFPNPKYIPSLGFFNKLQLIRAMTKFSDDGNEFNIRYK
jgi:hypothetical protein